MCWHSWRFLASVLSAQQITGNIRGTVTDPSGAVIRGAAVTARQAETGLSRVTTTDRNGNYVLLGTPGRTLPPASLGEWLSGIRAGWHHAQRERDGFGLATSRGRIGKAAGAGAAPMPH